MQELIKKHAEKLRFGVVGIANTALDFAILFILVGLGLNSIASNYISTAVAFVFSFFVNKSFTFKSTSGNVKKQFALFILITAFSLWIIQPIVILATTWLMSGFGLHESVVLFVAKVLATGASLVWNYIFYSRFVFKKEK